MKRIFFILSAVIAFFISSCSNEDIPLSEKGDIVFKINPETVIKPFTFEINEGELQAIDSNCKLRVRLLVYDAEGQLKDKKEEMVNSYVSKVEFSSTLEYGVYTAVVITDIVNNNGTVFWTLSEESVLSKTTLTKAPLIGGDNAILGIGVRSITVGPLSQDEYINPAPAGALLCLTWLNMQAYTSIKEVTLENNRVADYLVMNSEGKYDVAIKNEGNKFMWRTWYIKPFENNIDVSYNYNFVLPMSTITYRYRIEYNDETYMYSKEMHLNVEPGQEYLFYCNMKDANYDDYWITDAGLVNENSRARSVVDRIDLHPFNHFSPESVKLSSLINNK